MGFLICSALCTILGGVGLRSVLIDVDNISQFSF